MEATMVARLEAIGVPIHKGGLDGTNLTLALARNFFLAIYEDSEKPTEEELEQIEALRQHIATRFGASLEVKQGISANMVTIRKTEGRWTFRKMTWTTGPSWHPETRTLEDVRNRL